MMYTLSIPNFQSWSSIYEDEATRKTVNAFANTSLCIWKEMPSSLMLYLDLNHVRPEELQWTRGDYGTIQLILPKRLWCCCSFCGADFRKHKPLFSYSFPADRAGSPYCFPDGSPVHLCNDKHCRAEFQEGFVTDYIRWKCATIHTGDFMKPHYNFDLMRTIMRRIRLRKSVQCWKRHRQALYAGLLWCPRSEEPEEEVDTTWYDVPVDVRRTIVEKISGLQCKF